MTSGILMRGVPVEVVHGVSDDDIASRGFAQAQGVFERSAQRRTRLLPALVRPQVRLASHLMSALTEALSATYAGEVVDPVSDTIAAALAELQLRLIEALAMRAGDADMPLSALPVPPPSLSSMRYAIRATGRPEWVASVVAVSAVRTTGTPEFAPPATVQHSPVARLRDESAFWRTVSPHGGEVDAVTYTRGESLRTGLRSSQVDAFVVDTRALPDAVAVTSRSEDWTTERNAFLSSRGSVPDIAREALEREISRRFETVPPPPALEQSPFILSGESVDQFVASFNFFGDFYAEPL